MKFEELKIKKEILKVITENGYENPTEIQEKIIPLIMDHNDVIGQSQTGTGKTLAFAAPILSKIQNDRTLQAIILSPTRELAIQIYQEIQKLGKYLDIRVTPIYGSSSISDQIKEVKKGVEIVVGTPGRVKDLINRKVLNLDKISFFVLDEADEMLSMGFQEEIEDIFKETKEEKQVLLFSATMPSTILTLAQKYMHQNYQAVSIIKDTKTAQNIMQKYYLINDNNRLEAMCRIMDFYHPGKAIIFCRTKRNADEVLEKLSNKKYSVDIIHGDITQGQRIATLDRFKAGIFNYLIATDVAARGIHVDDVDLIVNYNLPESNEAYIHRIGRTGRANKSGMAITFVKDREEKIITSLENKNQAKIEKSTLPTQEEILNVRKNIIIDQNNEKINSGNHQIFASYLETLTEKEKDNLLNYLLEKELSHKVGSNFSVDVTTSNKKTKKSRTNNDTTRVFMTIGKIDQIEKKELLSFLEKKAHLKEGTFSSVEIMTKFTFMSVANKYYQEFINKCNNIKYKNRLIKIEKAKK